jgi:FtsZ-binding cell division protein ZapB
MTNVSAKAHAGPILVFLVMMLLPFWGPASAQDFEQLFNAVDKIEAKLAEMIQAEAATRQKQFDQMQNDISEINSLAKKPNDSDSDASSLLSEQLKAETQVIVSQFQGWQDEISARIGDIAEALNEQSIRLSTLEVTLAESSQPSEPLVGEESAAEMPLFEVADSPEEPEQVFGDLAISGFFDAVSSYQNSQEDKIEFAMNQAEIDIESEISDRAAGCVAVAYNGETGNFELAVAELAISLYNSDDRFLKSLDFGTGQFDIPFGIDCRVYASIDRKLITGPAVVDETHGGWNDFGFYLSGETDPANFVVYWVNGFEATAEVTEIVLNLETDEEEELTEEINTTPAYAMGGRLGFTYIPGLELGTSFAFGINESGKSEMNLWGADLTFEYETFELKGEFIYHSSNRSIAEENSRGYYTQASYGFNAFTLTGRYGSFKPEGEDWTGGLSLGAGYAITEGVEIRFETTFNNDSDNNLNLLQFVAGF